MEFIKDIFRGAAIGVANIIPGVSGGTMMISMGIYQDVIGAVTGIWKHLRKSTRVLLPYAIGMFLGIVGLSFIIEYFFLYFPFQTAMLFIGLIFGGLPLMLPKVKGGKPSVLEVVLFLSFFVLIVWMQFWDVGADKTLTFSVQTVMELFLVGALAAATMVIPGVSGSMMLMSLGYYTPIINQINAWILAVLRLDMAGILSSMEVLVPFGVGVMLGIFLIAKLVEYLLERHERKTYFAILGLVIASPVAVLAGMDMGSVGSWAILTGVVLFFGGTATAWLLGK